MNELDKFLEFEEDRLHEEQIREESFRVDNDRAADWCLRKIKEIRKEYERVDELLEKQISELRLKRDKLKAAKELDEQRFIDYLAEYARDYDLEMRVSKTQQSYKLSNGSMVFKFPKSNLKPDRELLLESLKKADIKGKDNFIEQTEKLKWAELKKRLSIKGNLIVDNETGEVIELEGLEIENIKGEYTVRISE